MQNAVCLWTVVIVSGKYRYYLDSFNTVPIVSILSRLFQYCPEGFNTVWTISILSRQFWNSPEGFNNARTVLNWLEKISIAKNSEKSILLTGWKLFTLYQSKTIFLFVMLPEVIYTFSICHEICLRTFLCIRALFRFLCLWAMLQFTVTVLIFPYTINASYYIYNHANTWLEIER